MAEQIKDRGIVGRALFLDAETPRPDRDAGSHAAIVEMELVQALGWKISFLPLNLAWLGNYSEDLQRRGIELLHAPFVLSLERFLQERGQEFDLVYLTRYTVALTALPLLQRHAPGRSCSSATPISTTSASCGPPAPRVSAARRPGPPSPPWRR